MTKSISYNRQVPVRGEYDVIVAGAGPAGICAAVTAARLGAKTALLERYGILGGNLTSGYVGPILGAVAKGTMRDELLALLGVPDNDMIGKTGLVHDFEAAKRVLAEFAQHENLDVYLQSAACDALTQGNMVTGVIVSSKEGLFALHSSVVVDATGDGDISLFAGATVERGREDGLMQPATLEFTISGVDETRAVACIGDVDDVQLNGERFLDFCRRCGEEGILPRNLVAVRLHRTVRPGERQVNTTQANRVDGTSPREVFKADLELRRQIDLLLRFFREHLPGYENCAYRASGSTTGIRETRRVMGDHVLTAEEMASGVRNPAAVVHGAEFIVDIHNPTGPGQAEAHIQYVPPYDIPYGCFLPKDVENLLTAGRCISGTHRAHASYRVMTICMAMGQAAGTAAALSAKRGCTPRELPVKDVREALREQGADLDS